MARTLVIWKWEDEREGDDPLGPVWVETFEGDSRDPIKSEKWDRWVPLSEARTWAESRGFDFLED